MVSILAELKATEYPVETFFYHLINLISPHQPMWLILLTLAGIVSATIVATPTQIAIVNAQG